MAHVSGVKNPAADYLSRIDINLKHMIHLKTNVEIPLFEVKTDLASKTPEQDDDGEQYITDEPNSSNHRWFHQQTQRSRLS